MFRSILRKPLQGVRSFYTMPPNREPDYALYGLITIGFVYLYDKYKRDWKSTERRDLFFLSSK